MNKLITHSVNYYGQQDRLDQIYTEWYGWKHMIPQVTTQVIDDGHPIPAKFFADVPDQLARITTDIPYNSAGTINLAAALGSTPYLLHSDMDIAINYEAMFRILCLVEEWIEQGITDRVLGFDLTHATGIHKSNGAWLCPIPLFWKLGGFDEDFVGHYGWEDCHFFEKVRKYAILEPAAFPLTFLPEHSVPMERDTTYNKTLLDNKITNGLQIDCNHPLRFGFEVIR